MNVKKRPRTLAGDIENLPAWAWLVILVPLWIIAFAVNIGY